MRTSSTARKDENRATHSTTEIVTVLVTGIRQQHGMIKSAGFQSELTLMIPFDKAWFGRNASNPNQTCFLATSPKTSGGPL